MGAIDNTWNKLLTECIHKEERVRWNHPANVRLRSSRPNSGGDRTVDALLSARGPGGFRSSASRSAAVRFLEEKTGLEDPTPPTTRELLYRGVSHDGKGRAKYLKERRKTGVTERYSIPLTETQSYDLSIRKDHEYIASPNCKKPIIQRSFFRTMGVDTYKGLPAA